MNLQPLWQECLPNILIVVVVAFPAFLLLARLGRHALLERSYLLASVALQALFMAAWSQFNWLG